LFQFFLSYLGVEFDMVDILLLSPKILYNLKDCLKGLDYLLNAAPSESFGLLAGLQVGVDVR
jgi:cellobiose-specific phosphotransferase system component IIB